MTYKQAKPGVNVYFIDFPDDIGEIIEVGNDYIHIMHVGSKTPLTIDPSDLKNYRIHPTLIKHPLQNI